MSNSQTIVRRVEQYAQQVLARNPLMTAAIEGRVTPTGFSTYLENVAQLLDQSPRQLRRACALAKQRGRPDLATFFAHKCDEEDGHADWASSDLAKARAHFDLKNAPDSIAELRTLVEFLDRTIDDDPVGYMAYIFLVEYLIVLIGPTWVESLETNCGIPSDMVSVVVKHVELDKHHVDEGIADLDRLTTEADRPVLERVLEQSIAHYDSFYSALARECAQPRAA